jgi:hypothetical protein
MEQEEKGEIFLHHYSTHLGFEERVRLKMKNYL